MSNLSRRKLITAGLAATAGASGLAVGRQSGTALRTGPTRSRRPLRLGRNANLCRATGPDQPLDGAGVPSQPDFENAVRQWRASQGRSLPAPAGRRFRRLAARRRRHGRAPRIVFGCRT